MDFRGRSPSNLAGPARRGRGRATSRGPPVRALRLRRLPASGERVVVSHVWLVQTTKTTNNMHIINKIKPKASHVRLVGRGLDPAAP